MVNSTPNEEYLSKEIAAKRLDISVRRLMELSQSGKIERFRRTDPVTNRDVAIFAAADIERMKGGWIVKTVKPRKPRQAAVVGTELAAMPPVRSAIAPVARPWLTLAEAAEYSGLPAAILRELIEGGKLRALNVGVRPGGVWRVRRAELDAIEGGIYGE